MGLPKAPFSLTEYRFILRNDLTSFIHAAFLELNPETKYVPGPHIEAIAAKLEACRTGEIKRLIINLPPRNLKSHCVSIAFPAWLLGHDPSKRLICVSYGQDLADKMARDTRGLMSSPIYQALFSTQIADRQAVHDFETTAAGGRMATSVGGVLTGRGGDIIISDDPLKPEEALSETQRRAVNDWYRNTLLSRLNDKANGCIIIVMQRLHQEDLVGHVLEQGEHWDVLSFPAIAEEDSTLIYDTPFGKRAFKRKADFALHPERESLETLQNIRRQIGDYNFASQYQQSPTPPGGAIVKTDWLKYYEPGSEPSKMVKVQSWDTANKASELSDFSVCTTWGIVGQNAYLLHVFRKKLNFPELKRAVIDLKTRFKPNRILIEDKASGVQLIQELRSAGVNVRPYMPPSGTDKLMRLHAQTTFFENGRVFLPKTASWLGDYVDELTGFPGTKYADQVDLTTQFLDDFRTHRPFVITEEMLRRAAQPTAYTYRHGGHGAGYGLNMPFSLFVRCLPWGP